MNKHSVTEPKINEQFRMHDLRTIDIPKITDGEKFEYLCRDLWRNNPKYEFVELNGRKGQTQFGVDVFGRNTETEEWLGIQCKVKATGKALTKTAIETEVNKAKLFNPSLSVFLLCTTLDRDANVQKIVRVYKQNFLNQRVLN